MSAPICRQCDATLDAESCAGICKTCLNPEALAHRIANMPEPFRGTFERVAGGMGLINREDTP